VIRPVDEGRSALAPPPEMCPHMAERKVKAGLTLTADSPVLTGKGFLDELQSRRRLDFTPPAGHDCALVNSRRWSGGSGTSATAVGVRSNRSENGVQVWSYSSVSCLSVSYCMSARKCRHHPARPRRWLLASFGNSDTVQGALQ